MHAKFQAFCVYRYLQIIYVSIGFLEFYTNQYYDNNRMVKFTVYIFSHGFIGNLVSIFMMFIQISMNFGSLKNS
jgi:hypothetical protein